MKLIISPECQIGAHKIQIRQSENLLDKLDFRGSSNLKEQIIRLSFEKRELTNIWATLVHEGLHISGQLSGLDLKEGEVIALSEFLGQFLLSLGIEPDFSRIPTEEL